MRNKNTTYIGYLLLSIVLVLCYFILFHNLGGYSIRMWDEGRNGINALEMLRNNNLLVTYFKGEPDMWNTKPPLFIWMVALFFKLFGISELSLRLPSAIAAFLVVVSVFLFCTKFLKSKWIGFLSSLVLLSSVGFSDIHIGRSGDFDALLVLFVFLGSLSIFLYTENLKTNFLKLSIFFLTLAVLTKGVAGLFMLPGIVMYLLITNKTKIILSNKIFWKSLGISLFIVFSYYLIREQFNPGYLSAVWDQELFGRYGSQTGAQGTDNTFWYYWDYLASFRFRRWSYLLPVVPLAYFLVEKTVVKNWLKFSSLLAISYFMIISFSSTRNLWYDSQLYPFISILVGVSVIAVIKNLPLVLRIFAIAALCVLVFRLTKSNLEYIHQPDIEGSNSCIKYGYLLRDRSFVKENYIWVHNRELYCMPFIFYSEKEGIKTKFISDISVGDMVLSCDADTLKSISEKFVTLPAFDSQTGCFGVSIVEESSRSISPDLGL